MGCGLVGAGSVPCLARFFFLHNIQPSSRAHPSSYLIYTVGDFPEGKAAAACC
jgi:hypothetical protein